MRINLVTPEQKARLLYRCRRGMLELDLILKDFINNNIDLLTEHQLKSFEYLLEQTDPEINFWLLGHDVPKEKELADIVTLIRLKYHTK